MSFSLRDAAAFIILMGLAKALPIFFGGFLTHTYGHAAFSSYILLLSLSGFLVSVATMGIIPNILSTRENAHVYANTGILIIVAICIIICAGVFMFPTLGVSQQYAEIYPAHFDLLFIATYGVGFAILQIISAQLNQQKRNRAAGAYVLVITGSSYLAGVAAQFAGADITTTLAATGLWFLSASTVGYIAHNRGYFSRDMWKIACQLFAKNQKDFYYPSLFTGILMLTQYCLLSAISNHNSVLDFSSTAAAFQLFAIGLFIPGVLGHLVIPRLEIGYAAAPTPWKFLHKTERQCFALYAALGAAWVMLCYIGMPYILAYYKLDDTQAARSTILVMQVAAMLGGINALINQKFVSLRKFGALAALSCIYSAMALATTYLMNFTPLSGSMGFVSAYIVIISVGMVQWQQGARAAA